MNPIDPDDFSPELGADAALPQPPESLPQPKPKPPVEGGGTGSADLSGIGDGTPLVQGVAEVGVDAATELGGAALDAAGTVADVAGSALEGAGSALEAAGGGCSLAILVTLFAAAGTAVAIFR